jgi:hypothetical protein
LPQPQLTSPPALVRPSPDAWACGDDSPSRRNASELEAWWRGLDIYVSWSWESGGLRSESDQSRASFEQVFWRAAKN